MFGGRLYVEADLELLSPLHLGTGESTFVPGVVNEDTGEPVPVATVVRDVDGAPYLPGSSVKGVLRQLVGNAVAEDLFGPLTIDEDNARIGRLTLWSARLTGSVPGATGMPHEDKPLAEDEPQIHATQGLYIAARIAIDPGSGAAVEKRLFHQQMVAPGARFRLRLELREPDIYGRDALLTLLGELTRNEGIAFGRGQSLGQGRLRLDPTSLHVEDKVVDPVDGSLRDPDAAASTARLRAELPLPRHGLEAYLLELRCDGPFLIDDSSVKPKRDSGLPRLNAQKRKPPGRRDEVPLLPGSSLIGVLRHRAAFLSRLLWKDARAGDDRDRILALDDEAARRVRPKRTVIHPKELRPCERLFGVSGWRGLVAPGPIHCTSCAGFENITSVKLDRFSMAPIDGGLFTARAAVDPCFEVLLELHQRGAFPNDDDRQLFERLLTEIVDDGLMLGHGTARGYGWFDVRCVGAPFRGGIRRSEVTRVRCDGSNGR